MSPIKSVLGGVLVLATAAALPAYAAGQMKPVDDAKELSKAHISMIKAISLAQKATHGKATRAQLFDEKGALIYTVETVHGKQVMNVDVRATDGRVLATRSEHPAPNGAAAVKSKPS
ncbi:MAG TPA: PepSY domain-containing protein [Burkholderiales bacterium]|nr:PepSY domain-containing protein [Burkholderiales bacterium]